MLLLDGKVVADVRKAQLKNQVEEFKQACGRSPCLAVILVGEDPASQVYVGGKIKACGEVGITSKEYRLSAQTSAQELITQIKKLNVDSSVDGMLLQLPLPKGLDADAILSHMDAKKDPDGLTLENAGLLFAGRPRVMSCTPKGVMSILAHYKIDVAGKTAVVIGRSAIVGKPMAQLLLNADATVTMCHSRTKNLREHTRAADIVVVAAGHPEMLGREDFKPQAVVIDVGIHRKTDAGKKKLVGDVRFEELKDYVAAATPVPGGVGPMTIVSLLENTLILAKLRAETAQL